MTVSAEQTVATLRARAARDRAVLAAQAEAMWDKLTTAIGVALPAGSEAWLIGTLAWGGFGERSDIDVVVRGVTREAATRLEIELTGAIEWPVEVLRFEDLPGSFQNRVEKEGIALHAV